VVRLRLDGGGAVVRREAISAREPPRIADLTEHDGGDDGADAVELGQAGPRCCDRGSDAALQVLEVAVEAPDVTEEVLGQALAFDLDRARGPRRPALWIWTVSPRGIARAPHDLRRQCHQNAVPMPVEIRTDLNYLAVALRPLREQDVCSSRPSGQPRARALDTGGPALPGPITVTNLASLCLTEDDVSVVLLCPGGAGGTNEAVGPPDARQHVERSGSEPRTQRCSNRWRYSSSP